MKTSVMEVKDMLSVFSVDEVEKRIGEVPGVESVTVNFAAGKATVRFDETRLAIADIKSAVRQRGLEAAAPADVPPSDAHEGHPAAGVAGATPSATATAAPGKAASAATANTAQAEPPAAPAAEDGPKDRAVPEKS
jgi:Cu2+-exporting ATPase